MYHLLCFNDYFYQVFEVIQLFMRSRISCTQNQRVKQKMLCFKEKPVYAYVTLSPHVL